jgi:hypothetical protein
MIQELNKEMEDEFLRLAQEKRRLAPHQKESRLSIWLGVKYLTGSGTGRLHSSTAFVEFRTLASKQQAIQTSITGMNNVINVSPVPEIRDIIWDNAHVSRALIDSRKWWLNVVLIGGFFGWSSLVVAIRSYGNYSDWLEGNFSQQSFVEVFLDTYLPALVIEVLARAIPLIIRALCRWIRFKAASEIDQYVIRWYFAYRLLTFIFVLVGGTLIDSSDDLISDPV